MKEKLENMPILVFLLIGVALAGFNYMNSLATAEGLQTQISQLNTQMQEKKEALTKAQNASSEIPAMRDEVSKMTESLAKARDLIPSNSSTRDVVSVVTEEAKNAGIRVTASRPGDSVTKATYFDEMPMEVEFEGSFAQLTLFMYQISKRKLIIHPSDMMLSTKEVIDGQTNLRMSGKLVGFRYNGGNQQ